MSLAVTYVFSPTTTIRSSEVNQNFSDVVNFLNNIFQPGIVFWFNGAIGSIPSAYYYCDGNNSTPDIKKRSIRGVGDGLNLGDTGGAETINIQHSHTVASHNHTISTQGELARVAGDHGSSGFSIGGYYTVTHNHGGSTGSTTPGTNNALSTTQSVLNPYIALVPIMIK